MWLLLCRCYGNQSCSAAGSNWELEEKDGKERKKDIEKEGGISAGMGKKVVTNSSVLLFFYHLQENRLGYLIL